MALAKPAQMFSHASQHHYGLAAFNVYSIESLLAVLDGAQKQRSPAIIQVSMGARKYVKHLKAFIRTIEDFARQYTVPFCIQHDHCSSIDDCIVAIDSGVQAVMYDGSHAPYEENLRATSQIVQYAHERDVWVEAELGCLPGFEDLIFSEAMEFTKAELVPRFITESGCDALAIAVGTSHGGMQSDSYLSLNFTLLKDIIKTSPGFPFVLHGGASLPPELIAECNRHGGQVEGLRNCSEKDIRKAVDMGIQKVNMDVDNFLVFTTATRKFLNESPEIYDPRKYLSIATSAFQQEVEHKLRHVMNSSEKY